MVGMKKYMILLVITLAGLAASQCAPAAVKAYAPAVEVRAVERKDIEIGVFCTGKIGEGKTTKVVTEIPVLAEAKVSIGDKVKQGDVIASIDRSATIASLASICGLPTDGVSLVNAQGQTEVFYNGTTYVVPENLVAPVDGTVTQINVEKGKLCGMDTPIAILSDGDGCTIAANINESQIAKIEAGQRTVITGSGFSGSYDGYVKSIASSAKQVMTGNTTETVVEVTFVVNEPDEALKPGFTAKVKVIVDAGTDVLLAPYESLCRDDASDFVYLAGPERAVRRDVVLGREVSEGVEILSGVEEGDMVVVNPSVVERSGAFIKRSEGAH